MNAEVKAEKVIPVIRVFDYEKAKEFYIEWLGFTVNFEHSFHDGAPKYIEVERGGVTLHLSEHHGDATPGSQTFIWCTGIKEYHEELIGKNYKFNRPGLEETFYEARAFTVHDPFGNRICFNEKKAGYKN